MNSVSIWSAVTVNVLSFGLMTAFLLSGAVSGVSTKSTDALVPATPACKWIPPAAAVNKSPVKLLNVPPTEILVPPS